MDFRFNHLRNVKKVNWKQEAPWYCEVRDGLNWFGYCLNEDCETFMDELDIGESETVLLVPKVGKRAAFLIQQRLHAEWKRELVTSTPRTPT